MKTHLKVTDPAQDAEVTRTIAHASEAIWEYLDPSARRPTTEWDATTAPALIQAHVMILGAAYFENRGDDESADKIKRAWDAVQVGLVRWRDPAVA